MTSCFFVLAVGPAGCLSGVMVRAARMIGCP
jgi:hypothetical protein